MAAIDSILAIVVQERATELRLGTDREPEMYRHSARLRLALDQTSDETLRHLLGSLLTPQHVESLRGAGTVEVDYDAGVSGNFHVVMSGREGGGGIDVAFHRHDTQRVSPAGSAAQNVHVPAPAASKFVGPLPLHVASSPCGAPEVVDLVPTEVEPPAEASEALVDILGHSVALRATDIHLREGEPPVVRIDGRLQRLLTDPIPSLDALFGGVVSGGVSRVISYGRSIDVGFAVTGIGRFRLNVYVAAARLCASIRALPEWVPSISSLHLPAPLEDLIDLPHGLVIACGPTGSGKSTTLAALAQEALRRRSIVLITLEDPIEYALRPGASGSLVRQREVGRDVQDFPTGLRDALREDPDVLLIGEMRDAQSIGLTLTAAETGHLVLASLHSRSSASAVERMVDAYPPERQQQIRVQVADALRAVVSQRLLPRATGEGRVVALEILRVNHNVANMIREGRTAQIATAMQSGHREGQLPLEKCLAELVRAGEVRVEDARAVANDTTALSSYLQSRPGAD